MNTIPIPQNNNNMMEMSQSNHLMPQHVHYLYIER